MEKLVQQIFPSAFDNQFQDPQTVNSISFEQLDNGCAASNTNQHQPHKEQPSADAVYTSRPSDFRLKAILCEGLATMQNDECRKQIVDDGNHLHKQQQQQQQKLAKSDGDDQHKSMQKLFDEFIVDFNKSIEWYGD